MRKHCALRAVVLVVKFAGIYNADGTLRGELAYVFGKVTGRAHCELCDITHGAVRRKRSWDAACSTAALEIELLHRDEADAEQLRAAGALPAVVVDLGRGWTLAAGPDDLARCEGDPERLVNLLVERTRSTAGATGGDATTS